MDAIDKLIMFGALLALIAQMLIWPLWWVSLARYTTQRDAHPLIAAAPWQPSSESVVVVGISAIYLMAAAVWVVVT